jgi:indolepyruvate ferredoxin oxidoreductase, alpha subunit
VLCPSFYRAEVVQNASAWDRFMHRLRQTVISWLAPREAAA